MNADSKDPLVKYSFTMLEKVIISSILSAIIEKDYTKLEKLLELEKKQPNRKTIPSFTPLHFAAEIWEHETAEILIQHGADANARYISLLPTDLIPPDVEQNNTPDLNVMTPIFIDMKYYVYNVIVIVLRAEARNNILSQKGKSRFLWLSYVYQELFKLILPQVEGLNDLSESNSNLMQRVIIHFLDSQLQRLLQHDANSNFKYFNGEAPLIIAAIMENLAASNMLFYFGRELETINETEHTALDTIAETIRRSMFRSISDQDRPMIFKDIKISTKICNALLCLGVNPNACDDNGWTVFERAVGVYSREIDLYRLDEDLIEWLLMHGVEWKNARIKFLEKKQWIKAKACIAEYYVKRQLAGLKFQIDDLYEWKDLLKKDFKEQCIAELEKMKTLLLFENMTMYRFLRCSSKRSLASMSSRKEVKQIDKQALFTIEFPIYKNLLEYNFIEGKMYEPIYKCACDYLNNLCNYRLPDIVLDKIIDYININDIDNLKKAQNINNK